MVSLGGKAEVEVLIHHYVFCCIVPVVFFGFGDLLVVILIFIFFTFLFSSFFLWRDGV